MYFFVYYTSSISIRSNVGEYTVELFWKSIAKTFTYDCPKSECILEDISPLEYNMTIKKEGYIDFFQNIIIEWASRQELIITLEKKVTLKKEEEGVVSQEQKTTQEPKELTAQEKIAKIRKDKIYFKVFDISWERQIGFKEKRNGLDAFLLSWKDETLIHSFEKISKKISLQEIEGTDYVFLEIGTSKYLYDLQQSLLSNLSLVPDISYIKQGRVSTELLFITDKGAFVYNIWAKQFDYFYFFRDFVYLDGSYIGIIYKDEEQKKQNYSLEEESQNLIIRYNPNTQERDILYKTNLDIERIYKQWDDVFFEAEGEKYKLDNY